ncbi:MAG: 2-succinyl-5-enolpyruvyl-6-hydroxy-3-cyclohexene-1-carboxylic-acid synthase [Thermoleophilaceae bacterium]
MIPVNRTYAPIQALAEELARCGMRNAVTSPGSRNAPLVLALAATAGVRAHSVIDERSAGFVALGLAKASGRPVALTCTSGSALANLLPAVVEAHEARVPLIVLSADRPPELRGTGAGQAIDQIKLFGTFAKWFVEVGNHEPTRESAIHFRALACRAWHTAAGGRPGVVHLNFSLREPLAPVAEPIDAGIWAGRSDGGPWLQLHEPAPAAPEALVAAIATRVATATRGVIVCGQSDSLVKPVAGLAAATGWPVLAEPTSGLRCGPHDRSHVIAHYDVLLRSERFAGVHRPDLILRIGDTPTSKSLRRWLASASQLVVDPNGAWHEPTRTAETIVRAAPGPLCGAVAERVTGEHDDSWLAAWRAADALVPEALAAAADPFEPKIFAALADRLPDDALVWVASSMAIRDVESFFPASERALRLMSNRGANGIDGTASSAAGAAIASGGRGFLLTGELALLHDLSGLLSARRLGVPLTIVCANNGGGGIFDHLPLADVADPALYEHHIVTPSGVELDRVAALVGLEHRLAETPDEVRDAVDSGPGLIEVRTDRAASVARHREVFARVAEQL